MTEADLSGQLVVVAGGAGRVGGGVVRAALGAGAEVVVPTRPEDDRRGLPDSSRLRVVEADVSDAAAVASLAADLGAVDHVFASVGGWWQGERIPEISLDAWDDALATRLRPHLVVLSGLLPVVRRGAGSTYTVVAGDTLERPVAGAAPTSVVAAAVLGLTRAAATDVDDVRLHAIVLSALGPDRTADDVGAAWLRLVGDPSAPLELRV